MPPEIIRKPSGGMEKDYWPELIIKTLPKFPSCNIFLFEFADDLIDIQAL